MHTRVLDLLDDLAWKLRPFQEAAYGVIADGDGDVLLTASTAAGKTEAAWFPIADTLLHRPEPGIRVLVVSPLKSLINDQSRRLARYATDLGLPVTPWHGDVSQSRKRALLDRPAGALIITPESLEGLLRRHTPEVSVLFGGLRFAVLDEFHVLCGSERGLQALSLLHRLEVLLGRHVRRVALSATLGAPEQAAQLVRPNGAGVAEIVPGDSAPRPLDIDVRGYREMSKPEIEDETEAPVRDLVGRHWWTIVRNLHEQTAGRRALLFANSRSDVELLTALLRDPEVSRAWEPERYLAHHGSLSFPMRQEAEAKLQDNRRDVTAVCTSTLELGVDFPQLELIGQLGPPATVSGLRQRLGRTGRDGKSPSVLRAHVMDEIATPESHLTERLHQGVVQLIAMTELIAQGWVEPADTTSLHLSTLVHQMLSVVGSVDAGIAPVDLYRLLCQTGLWPAVSTAEFKTLLRHLVQKELLRLDRETARLWLDTKGERLMTGRDGVTVFARSEEFEVRHDGKLVGTLHKRHAVMEGDVVLLAGQGWKVQQVRASGWIIDVVPAPNARLRKWTGGLGSVHARVHQQMRAVYRSTDPLPILDETAMQFLEAGRAAFAQFALGERRLVEENGETLLFLWAGDRCARTVSAALGALPQAVHAAPEGVALRVQAAEADVPELLAQIVNEPPEAEALASLYPKVREGKYDGYLTPELMLRDRASRMFDVVEAVEALREVLSDLAVVPAYLPREVIDGAHLATA